VKPDSAASKPEDSVAPPVGRHNGGASTSLADLLSMRTTAHLPFLAQLGQTAHEVETRLDVLILFNTFPRLDVPSINVGDVFSLTVSGLLQLLFQLAKVGKFIEGHSTS
jgi:hypothetical protein